MKMPNTIMTPKEFREAVVQAWRDTEGCDALWFWLLDEEDYYGWN